MCISFPFIKDTILLRGQQGVLKSINTIFITRLTTYMEKITSTIIKAEKYADFMINADSM